MIQTEHVKWEVAPSGVGFLTICRPEALNAMKMEFLKEVLPLLKEVELQKEVKCVILTGEGEKSFSAGGDLYEESENCVNNHDAIREYNLLGGELAFAIMKHRAPFIAAVNGYSFGAPLALIAACDLSLAVENAVFALPTGSLGGVPGWGCTQSVVRLIGKHQANRMLLLNERLTAQEAWRIGLIGKLVKQEELMPEAVRMAETIANFAPQAMSALKRSVNGGLDVNLKAGFAIEHAALEECNTSPVFAEGIAAFLEKRPPDFNTVNKEK